MDSEDWGGEVVTVNILVFKGEGVEELIDMILLLSIIKM